MKIHRSLRYVIARFGGPAGRARRERSAAAARAMAARGIVVPALLLASLGAISAAYPGHSITGHVHALAAQSAASHALPARDDAVRSCKTGGRPWMYAVINGRPWMYAIVNGRPWMFAIVNGRPWMFAVINGRPWMFAVINGHPAGSLCLRAHRQMAA